MRRNENSLINMSDEGITEKSSIKAVLFRVI